MFFNKLAEAEDNILIYNLKRRCNNLLFLWLKKDRNITAAGSVAGIAHFMYLI